MATRSNLVRALLSSALLVLTTFAVASAPVALVATGALALAVCVCRPSRASRHWATKGVDAAVTVWLLATWLSFRAAGQPASGFSDFLIVLIAVLQFHVLRAIQAKLNLIVCFVTTVGVAFLSFASITSFFSRYFVWRDAGFVGPELFRQQLTLSPGNLSLGNATGTYLPLFAVCIAAHAVASARNTTRWSHVIAVTSWFASVMLGLMLVVTFSRATYLAILASATYLVIALVRLQALPRVATRWKVAETCLLMVAVLLFFGLLRPATRVLTVTETTVSQRRSNEGRFAVYSLALATSLEHPLLGDGPGAFRRLAATRLARSDRPLVVQAFNTFLQVAVEAGWVATASLASVFLLGIVWPFQIDLQRRTPDEHFTIAALASALVCVMVYNLFWSSLLTTVSSSTSTLSVVALLANLCDDNN